MLGKRIKEIRKERKLTQAQLAELVDCSDGFITQVERGVTEPSLKRLRRIAKALDVPLARFFIGQ